MVKKFFVAPGGPDHKNVGPHTMGKLVQLSFFMFSSLTLKNLQKSDCGPDRGASHAAALRGGHEEEPGKEVC